MCWITFIATPELRGRVAAPWRRPCRVIRGHAGRLDQPGELVRDVSRMQRAAVRLGEAQVGLQPIRAEGSLSLYLTGDVRDEDQHGVQVERSDPF